MSIHPHRVKDRPLDASCCCGVRLCGTQYLDYLRELREQARLERRILVTKEGIEDYRSGEMIEREGDFHAACEMLKEAKEAESRGV